MTDDERGNDEPPAGARAMSVVRWGLVAVMALTAFAALEYRYDWFGDGRSGAAVATYYCPMHPGVQQDHPGECPICSMSLVPMPAAIAVAAAPAPPAPSDVPGRATVMLTPERIQLMGLRTAAVVREPLASELRTVGTVAATERGLAVIPTRFAGWIEALRVAQTGDRVAKGQVLATVYSPELLVAQQEHLNAARWTAAPGGGAPGGLLEDSRHRLELLGVSRAEIDELERAGQPIRAMPVRSPVSGTVVEKGAVEGLYVQPGTALFRVADLSRVWVLADVYEPDMGRVRVGQPVTIELAAYPGASFSGKVAFVYPALNEETRTLRVRVELPNPGQRLKPGMYGTVRVQLDRTEAVVVPADAVIDTGAAQYVFLVRPGGAFEPRMVTLGARSGGKVQVRDGVIAGDTVVSTASFLLDSESRLRAAIRGAP